ncbi:MAG: glycoside hydrolase N-terminal domain-containing protein [Planctomycetota bacterium]
MRIALLLLLLAALAPAQSEGVRFLPEIAWSAFEGNWNELPDLEPLTPVKTGITDLVSLDRRPRPDRYALRFEGEIEVSEAGLWRFFTESDDGSRLWIGGQLVVDNGGNHARRRREGTIPLAPGRYLFRLDYHDAGGDEYLEVGATGPERLVLGARTGGEGRRILWYPQPASTFLEALPVGNGRLGAMVFGRLEDERIQLDEDSIWAGGPDTALERGDPIRLAELRGDLFAGRHAEASRRVMAEFSAGSIVRSHQTAGDLRLDFDLPAGRVTDFRRRLDLATGVAETSFLLDGVRHRRRVVASRPEEVLLVVLEADRPGAISLAVGLDRPADARGPTAETRVVRDGGELAPRLLMTGRARQPETALFGDAAPGTSFRVEAAPHVEGGTVRAEGERLVIAGADRVVLVVRIDTDFPRPAAASDRRPTPGADAESRIAAAVEDHRSLMARCWLELPKSKGSARATDARLAEVRRRPVLDPDLAALLFQYGRYLLVCSSRPGTLPANLQGLWNEHLAAPWNADYHLNINLQMNYWPAEVTNLADCHEPLFDLVDRLAERGERRAWRSFGCRGWVAPHATDAWAPVFTRATEPYWGFWHASNAWLCRHLFEHWDFGRDETFLRERAWPILRGAARFWLDWLVEDPDTGRLVSGPSTSPENSFLDDAGRSASLVMGPALDQQLADDLFAWTLAAAETLGLDADPAERDFILEVARARPRLAPGYLVEADGRLREWDRPRPEAEPGHRHVSPLYGLHPGEAIDPAVNPALAAAARRTLEARLTAGGAGTGWSRAWTISFFARLHDGVAAHEHLLEFARRSLATNLFDLHPPFQIDGNFGLTAGVAEMLLHSGGGVLELLPALPAEWPFGEIHGLRARGGFEVSLRWREGRLLDADITTNGAGPLRIRLGEGLVLEAPESWEITHDAAGLTTARPKSPAEATKESMAFKVRRAE